VKYNTEVTPLKLPKYGRSIQNMVDYALTIADKQERTRCAHTIIRVMSTQTPLPNEAWNHLAVMADFKLDIDYPCEILPAEELHRKPDVIDYPEGYVQLRVYGRHLVKLVRKVSDLPDTPEKAYTIYLIACAMKRCHVMYNGGLVEDALVFADIAHLTDGAISIPANAMTLPNPSVSMAVNPVAQSKNRNNNNRSANQNRQAGRGPAVQQSRRPYNNNNNRKKFRNP
jgi:hypothetical protein